MPSAKEKLLRRERILQFIRENRDAAPPAVIQTPRGKEENSLRQKKRVTFIHGKQQRNHGDLMKANENERLIGQGLTSCLITKSSDTRIPAGGVNIPQDRLENKLSRRASDCQTNPCLNRRPSGTRITGGENDPAVRDVGKLPRTDSECQFMAPGFHFLKSQHSDLAAQEVRLTAVKPIRKELKNKCDFFPKYVDNRPFKDQTTQTLYRESSAQTLAYLPGLENKKTAETLELFSLVKLLPGDKPPGLHEVEILERARKRWLFNEAIKTNFWLLLKKTRSMAIKPEFKDILEAFEWEQWIEREEAIQECQMMRLQIVIKMFDKREKEMHAASKIRIEQACERIEKKRQADLRKNEIEFQRGMRRLDMQLARTSRKWVKQSPMHALGSPCSEFYAPMLRHGVDPARRSFEPTTGRKAFDMRIDDLEKRVNMRNVKCPFGKLREWSKPKEYVREYEQNFCSDGNLQKLYESLKSLRTQADHVREIPNCLRKRLRPKDRTGSTTSSNTFVYRKYSRYSDWRVSHSAEAKWTNWEPVSDIQPPKSTAKGHEDLENLIHIYEGTYIGSIMQFLADEMHRLKEQRKLHFFCILAQRERWRREAGEAGLRQKENDLRMLYEDIFQRTISGHQETSQDYIDTVMTRDIRQMIEDEAAETIPDMARQIDEDIKRWLESLKLIQNPLNYVPLRLMLKDMVFPDMGAALQRHEKSLISQYIVEDVIFERVWQELEPYDVASTLTSDLIDRLIDNDLYLFSSDSESESPQKTSWYEVQAIIRKLIRQSVPGRRWQDETERIVTEAYNDLFDDMFDEILNKFENPPDVLPSDLIIVRPIAAMHDVYHPKENKLSLPNIESFQATKVMGVQLLSLIKKLKNDSVTKELKTDEHFKVDSAHSDIFDTFVRSHNFYKKGIEFSNRQPETGPFTVTSTMDILEYADDLKSMHGSSFFRMHQMSEVDSDTQYKHMEAEIEDTEHQNIGTESEPAPKPAPKPAPETAHKQVPEPAPDPESKLILEENDLLIGENEEEEKSSGGEEILIYSKNESTLFSFK